MSQLSRVTFHHVHAPFYPGDVAGITHTLAAALEARGIVSVERPAVNFAGMDREALAGYARDHLGVSDAVPDDVSDDDLRAALRNAAAVPRSTEPVEPGWDQLDALDRVHLEAFAKTKCRMGDIDPALTDDEVREQIRAVAAATLSGSGEPEGVAAKKAGKSK